MRIFRACRCRHLRRGGRVLWAATSQSGSSLSFSLMILPLHSFHALVVVVVFKLSQFVDNCNDCFCLFINWYDDNRLHNAKQEREREKTIKPCCMLFWPAYKSSWHHCACFVCFLVADDDDDDDVVAVVVLACHFTFYAVAAAAAAAYCLLRVYLRYVSTACVCVRIVSCVSLPKSARARVCIHTKNITDILLYIQERTLYVRVCVHWHASVVYN